MSRVWTAITAVIVLLLSWNRTHSLQPHRESGVLDIRPPTPFFHYIPDETPRGRILVIHGLSVSKSLMQLLCAALGDGGFEVYAIDLPGHGDSPVGFKATLAREAVSQTIEQLGPFDAAVGHSLGGGLLLDIAADETIPRMVLLSPAPTPLTEIDLTHTLVVSGGFDIPAINQFIPMLEGAEWWRNAWGAHATALYNARQVREIVRWLGGDVDRIRTGEHLFWSLVMLISSVALGLSLIRGRQRINSGTTRLGIKASAVSFVLAGIAAALILRFVPIAGWLHLYATSYLIGFVFLVGCALNALARNSLPRMPALVPAIKALAAAAYVILIVGLVAVAQFTQVTLSDGRWWRLPVIIVAGFPLFYFDETMLRTQPGWATAVKGILTRAILGACILSGALILNHDSAFLALVMHFVTLFWIVLWFLTDVVRRHTEDPLAAAIFACIINGWAFAAWGAIT